MDEVLDYFPITGNEQPQGRLLQVLGIDPDHVTYNPAVINDGNGGNLIAIRVEHKDSNWRNPSNYNPHIIFTRRDGDFLVPISGAPVFHMHEDPFGNWINDPKRGLQLLFGGVTADFTDVERPITTNIYLAPTFQYLDPNQEPFIKIRGMRDIRFAQLSDGRIAILTRPQNKVVHPGRIGFTIISSVDELSQEVVDNAPLLPIDIDTTMKMGTNEVRVVEKNGKEVLQVFCHVANEPTSDDEPLHYTIYEFFLDPEDPFGSLIVPHRLIGREDFGRIDGPHKGERFDGIVFHGGSDQNYHYVGIADSGVGYIPRRSSA